MARVIQTGISLPPFGTNTARRIFVLMTDSTAWSLDVWNKTWVQVPAIPGSRVYAWVYATSAIGDPFFITDMVYACATDGTVWTSPVSPFSWTQLTTTPP